MINMDNTTINLLSLVIAAIALGFSIISFVISYRLAKRQLLIEATNNQPIFDVSYEFGDEYIDITICNSGSKIVISQIDFDLALIVDIYHTSDYQFKGRYLIKLNSDKLRYETLSEGEWAIRIVNHSRLRYFRNQFIYVYTLHTRIMIPRIDIAYLNIQNKEDSRIFTYYEGCKLNHNYTLYQTSELAYENFLTDFGPKNYKNGLYDFQAAPPYQRNFIHPIDCILMEQGFFDNNGLPF